MGDDIPYKYIGDPARLSPCIYEMVPIYRKSPCRICEGKIDGKCPWCGINDPKPCKQFAHLFELQGWN